MMEGLKTRLDRVPEGRARNLNLALSTAAGTIYVLLAFLLEIPLYQQAALALTGFVLDISTVYFVHSGVLSTPIDSIMSERMRKAFHWIHVGPGVIAYAALLAYFALEYVGRGFDQLYYLFLLSWGIVYVTGFYSYLRLRGRN